ncbi:MAG: sulfotransferase [Calditrichaceae bacterium]|nr:sulfotransferase [Calditrichaceae bacterium]
MINPLKKLINPIIIKLGSRIEKKQFTGIPIIIGACPRSGTTILLSILGAHPNIYAIPNQTYAFDRWENISSHNEENKKWRPTRLDRLYLQFIIHRIPKTAKRWLEKTPKHVRSFEKILDYFQDRVKLINILRDGRAVVVSKHPKHKPDQYWISVERWIEDVNIGLKLDNHPSVLNIKYEDLINEFEKTMVRIYEFIGEEKPENLNEWINNTNIKKSMHWAAPVQNIYAHAMDRWRKPEHAERVKEFMNNPEAVNLLKKLGYTD